MEELNINHVPAPEFSRFVGREVKTRDELADLCREMLRSQDVAEDLNTLFIQHKVGEEALKGEISTKFLPVLVVEAAADEVKALVEKLFFGRNVTIEVKGETAENNEVVIALNKLKNQRKAKA
jgi:hypothetical protein